MKKSELMEILSNIPGDPVILIPGYEGGYNLVRSVDREIVGIWDREVVANHYGNHDTLKEQLHALYGPAPETTRAVILSAREPA